MTSIKELKEVIEQTRERLLKVIEPLKNKELDETIEIKGEDLLFYGDCCKIEAKISEHESVMKDIEKSLIADGKFTTSLNRKVCYEAGKRETLERVDKFIKELKEGFKQDWEICKKANIEPHIHPRRVIEFIDKLAEELK